MGKIIKIISDVLFVTGLGIAGVFLLGHFTGHKPFQAYIVSSGSMEPAIKTGSVVFVAPQAKYRVTDIVTYYSGADKKTTTTHRIVATDGTVYKMAGDANNQPDPVLVDAKNVIGTVRFSIPFIGYLAASAKTPQGFILLVIVPATIIIYEELKSLFLELKKLLSRLKNRKGHAGKEHLVSQPDAGKRQAARNAFAHAEWPPSIFKPAIILPIFFALLIPLTLSISYFIDRETSSGNSFGGFTPTPTPTPTEPLIIPLNAGPAIQSLQIDNLVVEPTLTPTPTPELPSSALILDTTPTPTPFVVSDEVGPLPSPTPTPDPNQIIPPATPTDVPN